jgi:LmbE family N-acetylglucosaminyl deacetylase
MAEEKKKILCVAHPDDECLWFNPSEFDKIIICFMDRYDNYKVFCGRRKALGQHPLKDKIKCLNITESGYNLNKAKRDAHQKNYKDIVELLKKELKDATEVYTHNSWGEYGHSDHIMVQEAVREVAQCPIYALDGYIPHTGRPRLEKEIDLDLYRQIKDVYERCGAWTWKMDYEPQPRQYYYKVN